MAQLVKPLPLAPVMISGPWDRALVLLSAQQEICFCLSLCPSPPHPLMLSLSNKFLLKKNTAYNNSNRHFHYGTCNEHSPLERKLSHTTPVASGGKLCYHVFAILPSSAQAILGQFNPTTIH